MCFAATGRGRSPQTPAKIDAVCMQSADATASGKTSPVCDPDSALRRSSSNSADETSAAWSVLPNRENQTTSWKMASTASGAKYSARDVRNAFGALAVYKCATSSMRANLLRDFPQPRNRCRGPFRRTQMRDLAPLSYLLFVFNEGRSFAAERQHRRCG